MSKEKIFRLAFLALVIGLVLQSYVIATTTYNLGGSVTVTGPTLNLISATINNQACTLTISTVTCPNTALLLGQTANIHIILNNDGTAQTTLTIAATTSNSGILIITNTGPSSLILPPNGGADLNFNLQAVGAGSATYSIAITG